ncbi:MAG: roadblock/LC7 domain-containing protein [Chloroflexota bacterium]|nr:roadblock/LC7 domain-containing protein [Chloroflexota bacterium]
MDQYRAKTQTALEDILNRIVADGDYEAALLSDEDGLPLAATATGDSAAMLAAMAGLFHNSATQASRRLNLSYINELSLVGDDRFRLVCRFFETASGQSLGLVAIVPPDHAYRRITNRAIREIKEAWAG